MAPGTALAQKRHGGDGITIVTGGDAGTAEGDFATCLVWSSRPGQRAADPHRRHQQPLGHLDRGRHPAGVPDHRRPRQGVRHAPPRPSTATTRSAATSSCRRPWSTSARSASRSCSRPSSRGSTATRAPRGRTSSPGSRTASREFEKKLEAHGLLTRAEMDQIRARWTEEIAAKARQVRDEPLPEAVDHLEARLRGGPLMASMAQAIRLALHYGEEHLGVTDVFGEDVGPPLGGVFTATQGLKTAWNSPLDERGIIGCAMGSRSPGSGRSRRSSSATTSSTPSTCSRSPATPAGRATATGTCRWW